MASGECYWGGKGTLTLLNSKDPGRSLDDSELSPPGSLHWLLLSNLRDFVEHFPLRHWDFVLALPIFVLWSQVCRIPCASFLSSPRVTLHPAVTQHAQREARDGNGVLASFITHFTNCQIIFLEGICLKPMPLACGLGNILDESLAQILCFSMWKWLTMNENKSWRKV